MSTSRHAIHVCPRLPSQLTALAFDFKHGETIQEHLHPEDQVVYATRGVMTVRTGAGIWVVPAQRAVWIPARTPHSISMSGAVSMRTLYLRARLVKKLPRSCCVVNVAPLLRELILQACKTSKMNRRSPRERHLIDLIVDQLETVQTMPLQLPTPSDSRALRVAQALEGAAGDNFSLEKICGRAGASRRTIERLFQLETSLSLGKWRQQLRLMKSLELLAAGAKITHAALEAGYSTPSSFIAMFRRALGVTPRQYFASARNGDR